MNKIKTPLIEWQYANSAGSQQHMQTAYDRLFNLAWQRILEKYNQQHISLWMTIKDN